MATLSKRLYKQILLLITFTVILLACLWKLELLFYAIKLGFKVLTPLFLGIGIAFVLNRLHIYILKFFTQLFKGKANPGFLKYFSLIITYIIFFAVLTALIAVLIPQLGKSLQLFYQNLSLYTANLTRIAKNLYEDVPISFLSEVNIDSVFQNLAEMAQNFIAQGFLQIFTFTGSVISFFVNWGLGFVISFYILADKIHLKRRLKMVVLAWLSPKTARKTIKILHMSSNTFSHFINGQLTEMVILSILCFIGMSIFRFQYPLLISIIIGVTNIIPIVGPIIGTVPSAFILLMENPPQAIWFIIFIIILQQIECNFIYPRIVGGQMGLPPLLVCLAVLVGGGLFGLWGMIISLPAASVFYAVFSQDTHRKFNLRLKTTQRKL